VSPSRLSWLQDCIARGVPCGAQNCNCAPEALAHFGVRDRGLEPHEYLPSELPPEFEPGAGGIHVTEVAEFTADMAAHLLDRTTGIEWNCPLGTYHSHPGGVTHISIELTEEEREKYREFFKPANE
jgi:proteasome lid subunit RPN8/RPN11